MSRTTLIQETEYSSNFSYKNIISRCRTKLLDSTQSSWRKAVSTAKTVSSKTTKSKKKRNELKRNEPERYNEINSTPRRQSREPQNETTKS